MSSRHHELRGLMDTDRPAYYLYQALLRTAVKPGQSIPIFRDDQYLSEPPSVTQATIASMAAIPLADGDAKAIESMAADRFAAVCADFCSRGWLAKVGDGYRFVPPEPFDLR